MTKKRRRRNPAPGVELLPDGRYRIRVAPRLPDGTRGDAERTMPHGTTLGQAIDARAELKTEVLANAGPGRVTARSTVADYVERWIEAKAKRVRPSTARALESVLACHLLPQMGHLPCESLTRADITDWLEWTEEQDITTATARKRWSIVRQVLGRMCAELGMADVTAHHDSPVTGRGRPRCTRALTAAELPGVMAALLARSPALHLEALTLVCTGMRVGEMYGLLWTDVDLETGTVRIHEGKTAAARRETPLASDLCARLLEHRRQLVASQHKGVASGLVFPSKSGGVKYPAPLWRAIRLAAADAGLDWVPHTHTLRRTYNTLALRARTDRIALRAVMGHTSEDMTEHYADLGADDMRPFAEAVWHAASGEKR